MHALKLGSTYILHAMCIELQGLQQARGMKRGEKEKVGRLVTRIRRRTMHTRTQKLLSCLKFDGGLVHWGIRSDQAHVYGDESAETFILKNCWESGTLGCTNRQSTYTS